MDTGKRFAKTLFRKGLTWILLVLVLFWSFYPWSDFSFFSYAANEWYQYYNYSLDEDEKTITLTQYNGSEIELEVPSTAAIGGDTYQTVLTGNVYSGCQTIKSIVFNSGVLACGNCAEMFNGCSNLEIIDLSGLNTCDVTDMHSMFYDCIKLNNLDFSNFDTSKVVNMSGMFGNCKNMNSLDLRRFKTDNVTDISIMFLGCSGLTSLNLSGFDTGKVKYMYDMFDNCSELTSLDLSNFNTSNVTTMRGMFWYCSKLKNLNINNFDTKNVTDMSDMFIGCKALSDLDLSGFDTDLVTNMNAMFSGCSGLNTMNLNCFNTSKVTDMHSMFAGCSGLTSLDISDFDTENVTDMASMFQDCSGLSSLDVSGFDTSHVKNMYGMFSFCSNITFLDVSGFDTSNVENMYTMFYLCKKIENLDVSKFNTGKVTNMTYMFGYCEKLDLLDVSGFNTSNVLEMYGMFFNCTGINDLDVSGFDTGRTKLMGGMFYNCRGISSIDVNGFDTSQVTGMDYMFGECSGLTRLDVSNFNTSNVERMEWMFSNCSSIKSIDISGFDMTSTTTTRGMFERCSNLQLIKLPDSISTLGEDASKGCINLRNIYYNGNESEWEQITIEAGNEALEKVNLFSAEDKDEQMHVSVSLQQVPGGVAVTMNSTGSSIYYTLDGTMPCTGSIPYEGTFILDEAGEYFINAIAFDLEKGTYGTISTEYLNLEQSASPTIREEGDQVILSAAGDIYYSLDITETPTVNSQRYSHPLSFEKNESACIIARVIETGKAPSDIVKYDRVVAKSGGLVYPDGTYNFLNSESSFGYGTGQSAHRIPKERYTSIFGNAKGSLLYNDCGGGIFGGACYGMSTTALLFYQGVLKLGDFSSNAKTVYELNAPASKDSELTKLIEEYQISQFGLMEALDTFNENRVDSEEQGNAKASEQLLHTVETACNGGDPVVLVLYGNNGKEHAVVPYRIENGQIFIYDCNEPYQKNKGENCIVYGVNSRGNYYFSYKDYRGISFNLLSTLQSTLDAYRGIQSVDEVNLSAEKQSEMLLSSNSSDFTVFDQNGKIVTSYAVISSGETKVISLNTSTYTFRNNDNSLKNLVLSAATDLDYYTVTVNNSSVKVKVSEEYGRLSVSIDEDHKVDVQCHTSNESGRENDLQASAAHLHIYACTEKVILIESDVQTIVANGQQAELKKPQSDNSWYFGSAAPVYDYSAGKAYQAKEICDVSTDITELPDASFSLSVFVNGAGEDAVLYAASYTETGKMSGLNSRSIETGRTKYVFDIPKEAKEVKIFVTDHGTSKPLTENIRIQ